jgi:hypothetical protein
VFTLCSARCLKLVYKTLTTSSTMRCVEKKQAASEAVQEFRPRGKYQPQGTTGVVVVMGGGAECHAVPCVACACIYVHAARLRATMSSSLTLIVQVQHGTEPVTFNFWAGRGAWSVDAPPSQPPARPCTGVGRRRTLLLPTGVRRKASATFLHGARKRGTLR